MKNSNKGLNHDEPILFEIGGVDKSGVDLNKKRLFSNKSISKPIFFNLEIKVLLLSRFKRDLLICSPIKRGRVANFCINMSFSNSIIKK